MDLYKYNEPAETDPLHLKITPDTPQRKMPWIVEFYYCTLSLTSMPPG